MARWRTAMRAIGEQVAEEYCEDDSSEYSVRRMMNYEWFDIATTGDRARLCLLRRCQGRLRKEMRLKINECVERREMLRQQGKTGYVIKSMLDRHATGYDMTSLDMCSYVELDPAIIHRSITDAFVEWFAGDGLQDLLEEDIADAKRFAEHERLEGVPGDVAGLLWQAYQIKCDQPELSLVDMPTMHLGMCRWSLKGRSKLARRTRQLDLTKYHTT
jgi:hypothetical protein